MNLRPEVTAKLLRAGHKIKEVPISYNPRTTDEGKKIGWRDGVTAITTLLKYRLTNPARQPAPHATPTPAAAGNADLKRSK